MIHKEAKTELTLITIFYLLHAIFEVIVQQRLNVQNIHREKSYPTMTLPDFLVI